MTPRKPAADRAKPKKAAAPKKTTATRTRRVRRHTGPQATPAPKRTVAPVKPVPSKAPNGFIVVDGSNVANSSRTDGKPSLHNIERVHDHLVHDGFEPVIFVDASLRHQIPESEKRLFEKWEGEAFIVQVPRGVNGDEAVLEFASRREAPVLSNDNYQDLEARYPWVRDRRRRVPYNLVRGELILYRYQDPPAALAPAPTPLAADAPAPAQRSPRGSGRDRQPREPPRPSPPAETAPPPAPPMQRVVPAPQAPPAAESGPAPEKHRNFRRPRSAPQQQTVPRGPASQTMAPAPPARPEPEVDHDLDHAPPQQRPRGRNQNIPRATDAEKAALKQTLIQLFDAKVQPGGSIRADQLSEETRRAIPGFRPNYYGSSSFTKLLDRMDDVFELARRGPNGQMASLEGPPSWPIVVLRRS